MRQPGVIASVRVTHEYATVEEVAAAGADSQREQVECLLDAPGVEEAFAIQTCNRSEAYVVAPSADAGLDALDGFAPGVREGAVVRGGHEPSLRHLLRVAAGLDSVVLGEDQVLGQVRTAYQDARACDAVGPLLEDAVTKALHVGERAREETAINEGHVSLGSAAVATASAEREVSGADALVVGAGEMGTVVANHLADAGAHLTIANRTVPHAEHLADAVADAATGEPCAVGLDALPGAVADADIVVSVTGSPEPLIGASMDRVATRDTLLVDLGQPRDVDPRIGDRPGVDLVDLDDVEDVTDATDDRRTRAAEQVETMVERELDRLLAQFKRRRADEAIAAMHEGADHLKESEVATAISRLEATGDLTDAQRAVVESLGQSLVDKLLASPTASLRDAAENDDWDTIRTALDLFDPTSVDGEAGPGAASDDADASIRPRSEAVRDD